MTAPKISHSAYSTYHQCPEKYRLHYLERIRPTGTSSALIFGRAVDDALNDLLVKQADPVKVFQEQFTWDACKDVTWGKYDLDRGVFTPEQVIALRGESMDYVTWACMRVKGRLMLEAYVEQVLPKIKEVISVQQETPGRKGFIDAVLSIGDDVNLLVDHKTSARAYEDDSVRKSTQLALYASSIGAKRAAFITLVKKIKTNKTKICVACGYDSSRSSHSTCPGLVDGVRCKGALEISTRPEAVVQIIVDDIDPEMVKLVKESFASTEKAIDAGHFPPNLTACDKMFGAKCPYYYKCKGGDMTGLTKLPEGEK